MATRLYFPDVEAAAVNPANTADWGHVQGTPVFRRLQKPLIAVALATTAVNPDGADHIADVNSLHRTYVSDPLAAQTIAGNVKAQLQCIESHASDNLFLTIKIFRTNGAGVLQDVMLAITRKGTEPTTSLRNTSFAATALTSRTFTEGDRIAIEIGLGGLPTSGSGTNCHNGSIRWGTTASGGDLPEDETSALTTLRPWIEFTADIAFAPNRPTVAVAGQSAVVGTFAKAAVLTVAGDVAGQSNPSADAYAKQAILTVAGAVPGQSTVEATYSQVIPLGVSTQAETNVGTTTATGNGTVTGEGCDERGVVYSTETRAAPGNVAPAASGYQGAATETGTFPAGAFTENLVGL